VKNLLLFLAVFILLPACRVNINFGDVPSFDNFDVNKIVRRAFKKAGGWDNWANLQSISYKKRSILYLENGDIESDVTQFHEYQLQPQLKGTIFWKDDEGSHSIVYENGKASAFDNGKIDDSKSESAAKTFLSAHYVLFMPFKLGDEGTKLSHEGTTTLDTGTIVDVIKATYAPGSYDNHSTNDEWYYYFDHETGEYLANMVYHAPTYAYIRNTKMDNSQPLIMNTYRESFRVDKDRNIEYLRGEFFYEDYQMTFKER
jgi:hypothetical protein